MAPSNNKPFGSDETQGPRSGDIRDTLTKTRIAPDLLAAMEPTRSNLSTTAAAAKEPMFDVIIEFNRSFPGGISTARLTLLSAYEKSRKTVDLAAIPADYRTALAAGRPRDDDTLVKAFGPNNTVAVAKSLLTDNFVFAKLSIAAISSLSDWTLLVGSDANDPNDRNRSDTRVPLVYKIWPDYAISRCVYDSVRTIKCDAARVTFAATGKGIVWAVADTGIDSTHPHFKLLDTTKLPDGLLHKDFTQDHDVDDKASEAAALTDQDGHGSHVAGIIAGFTCRKQDNVPGIKPEAVQITKITRSSQERNSDGTSKDVSVEHSDPISGLAPDCKLMSLKVLETGDSGNLSNLLAAIGYIQKCNDNGRSLKIHGLNLSLGYPFDPECFAAGQSPLCVEVDRLVRSGVCVVAAAGNGGYGIVSTYSGAGERAAHLGTIADPGNANLAITVGSTHRDMPHSYGVSYFSAKGPTSDGRMKPDVVAPGERIVSCDKMNDASGQATEALFREDSGTSMAAPHVSGAIAAFLSVRGEYKGKPEQVKDIIMQAATDLKRRAEFQGTGLLDLLRALQSV
jgi:serine protease AprX